MNDRTDLKKYLGSFGEKYRVETMVGEPTLGELLKSIELLQKVNLYPAALPISTLYEESKTNIVSIAKAIAKIISDLSDAIGYLDKMELCGFSDSIYNSILMSNIDKVKRNKYGKLTNASKKDIATALFKQNASRSIIKDISTILAVGEKMKKGYDGIINKIADKLEKQFYDDTLAFYGEDSLFNEIVKVVEQNDHLCKLIINNLNDKDTVVGTASDILGLHRMTGNVIREPKKNLFHPLASVMFNQNHPYVKRHNNDCEEDTEESNQILNGYSKEEQTMINGDSNNETLKKNIITTNYDKFIENSMDFCTKLQQISALFNIKLEGDIKSPITLHTSPKGALTSSSCKDIVDILKNNNKLEQIERFYNEKYIHAQNKLIDTIVSKIINSFTIRLSLKSWNDIDTLFRSTDEGMTYKSLIVAKYILSNNHPLLKEIVGEIKKGEFIINVGYSDPTDNPLYYKLIEAFKIIGPANRLMFDKEIMSKGLLIAKVPELNTTICEILAKYMLEKYEGESLNVILEDAEKISQYNAEYIDHMATIVATLYTTPIDGLKSAIIPPELEKVTEQMSVEDRFFTFAKAIIIYGFEEKVMATYNKIKEYEGKIISEITRNTTPTNSRHYKGNLEVEKEVIETIVELINKNEIGVYINRNGLFLNVEDPGHINTIIRDLKRNINFYLDKPFSSIPFGSIIATLPRYVLVKANAPYIPLTKYKEALKNLKS